MPFQVGNGCLPAAISDSRINQIARSDTSLYVSLWEKIKAFFCSTKKPEALELIRQICHPPAGTTREQVVGRFEQLRTLAYGGFEENVQSGRHGENHFYILDENSREMLSVTLDDAGKYTVKCQGYYETHHLIPDPEPGEKCAEHTEDTSGMLRTEYAAATTTPQTEEDYEVVWSEWKKAALPEEAIDRADVVRSLRHIQSRNKDTLHVFNQHIYSLPDHLPPCIRLIKITGTSLTSLPALPEGLQGLVVTNTPLTSLPALPEGLQGLNVTNTQLTSLPALPERLQRLVVTGTSLTSLPALPEGLQRLVVTGTSLTSLPPLPERLQGLDVTDTPLTSLPALPERLQGLVVTDTPLTSLPPLPEGLQELDVTDTPLTSLPPLPERLQRLVVTGTSLTSLPALPEGLQELDVTDTPLTSLPALPEGLQGLVVTDTPLTSLPALPEGLQELDVTDTPLTSLPPLPERLQRLVVTGTSLTSLPESISSLSPHATVYLYDSPLSERTRQALEALTHDPYYSGPIIYFSMDGPSAPREPRPLHEAVADWLAPAKEGKSAPGGKWQTFEQENDAASFSAFLDRLSETKNVSEDPGFKTQVVTWLTLLAEDDSLRAKTFTMATEATSTCEDRVTLALNQMKNVQQVHYAEKGKYDNNLLGLISTGREMFRLEKLEQIARNKVNTLRFVDEIEVYLGYQNKLKEPLGLTSVTKEMRFFAVSYITESDLLAAEIQVKNAENSQFREWILQWAPLQRVLKRANPEDWEALEEKKISDYEDAYRTLSDAELKPAGLTDNTDAERTVGVRALKSAEQAFYAGLRPLADRMLGGHLKNRWP